MSDRDLSVEKWLRQMPPSGGPLEDCLDAESLAAWNDGTLDGPARIAAEAHAANCARCQSMLAVMVRTAPEPAAPERWSMRKWLMMLSPAVGAAAAVAVWFAVDQRPQQVSSRLERESAPVVSPTDAVAPKEAGAAPSREQDVASNAAAATVAPDASASTKLADANKGIQPTSVADAPSSRQRVVQELEKRVSGQREQFAEAKKSEAPKEVAGGIPAAPPPTGIPAATPAPPAAPPLPRSAERAGGEARADSYNVTPNQLPPSPQQNQVAPNQVAGGFANAPSQQADSKNQQRTEQVGSAAESVTVTGTSPVVQTATASRTNAPSLDARLKDASTSPALGRGGAGGGALISSDGPVRWRVSNGQLIERSTDAGKTWSVQHTLPAASFALASAAPTSNVCWVVGRGGLVLLTTDARVWQPVKFPESVDLASVVAADARTATVTTIDGRQFRTTDGGASWIKQQ